MMTRVDEWGEWEQISTYGWRLVPGTETAEFQTKRIPSPAPPDPRIALRAELQAATTLPQLKAVLEKLLA